MLGETLKKLRLERDLTQAELAQTIGLARGTYTHYEHGTREPNIETLIKLAKYFDVSVDYLLGITTIRNAYDSTTWSFRDSEELKNLTHDEFDAVVYWINSIKNYNKTDFRKIKEYLVFLEIKKNNEFIEEFVKKNNGIYKDILERAEDKYIIKMQDIFDDDAKAKRKNEGNEESDSRKEKAKG